MSRRLLIVWMSVSVLLGGVWGVAYAMASSPVLTGCITPGGELGAVAVGELPARSCSPQEVQVTWNKPGDAGLPGAPGTDGAAGITGYEVVSNKVTFITNGGVYNRVRCPPGKMVLSGGYRAKLHPDIAVVDSGPLSDNSGWLVWYFHTAVGPGVGPNESWTWAVCAYVD